MEIKIKVMDIKVGDVVKTVCEGRQKRLCGEVVQVKADSCGRNARTFIVFKNGAYCTITSGEECTILVSNPSNKLVKLSMMRVENGCTESEHRTAYSMMIKNMRKAS